MKIIELYKRIIPRTARTAINRFYFQIIGILPKYRNKVKRRASFGNKNSDKTFYLIRMNADRLGLFAIVSYVLDHIQYAKDKGYFPIVDLKNYYAEGIQNSEDRGRKNAWEDFYQQNNYSLNEVYKSKRVVLCNMLIQPRCKYLLSEYHVPDTNEIAYFQPLMREYLKLNPQISDRIDKLRSELFEGKGRILGVAVRRLFSLLHEFHTTNASAHPDQSSLDDVIRSVLEYKEKTNCQTVFVCTDDREASDCLLAALGDSGISMDRRLSHFYKNGRPVPLSDPIKIMEYYDAKSDKIVGNGDLAIEYMIETYLLSRCDCMLASGMSGNVRMALLLNANRYEDVLIMEE